MDKKTLIAFLDMSPTGSLILDHKLNVMFVNKKLCSIFDGTFDTTVKQFGNLFRCENADHDMDYCGTQRQCALCPIRANAHCALSAGQTIDNIQVIRTFVDERKKKTRWFNMSFNPVVLDGIAHVWVSMTDLSEMMNYKVEKYLSPAILDDEILFDKGQFHESVLNAIEQQMVKGGSFGLLLINCEIEVKERGTFDKLWINKQLEAYHHMLVEKIDKSERVCRYDKNRYLLFTKASTHKTLTHRMKELKAILEDFEEQISHASRKLFSYHGIMITSLDHTPKFEFDSVDIEYFKWLATLESLKENRFITLEI